MVSTLDPHFHNGQRFMPATTRFLKSFYTWLNKELGIERSKKNRFSCLLPNDVTYPLSPSKTQLKNITKCESTWHNEIVRKNFKQAGFSVKFCPLCELNSSLLDQTDILYLPAYDDVFLHSKQDILLDFLANGGNLFICGEPAMSWLPFISPFNAVSRNPYTNMKIRLRDDRLGFFKNMPDDWDKTEGILGAYSRGWTDMPKGAIWITDVGTLSDPKPADWLWRYPTPIGKGGFVLVHNGNDVIRYPTYGENKQQLICDICIGLQELSTGKQIL